MKLIVLYGPENSGKTTSLKMVYEVLKGVNRNEKKVFRYVDHTSYLDYLDVLEFERTKTKAFFNQILTSKSSSVSLHTYTDDNIDTNDIKNACLDSINTECEDITFCADNDVAWEHDATTSSTDDMVDVGIELEGDWGDGVSRTSLYNLLDELKKENCDIILCACRNASAPIKCLLNFIKTNRADVYLIPTSSSRDCKSYAAKVLYVLKCIL